MFERFTDNARRIFFFARYEASQSGGQAVEPEHVLLGILREDKQASRRLFQFPGLADLIRSEIEALLQRPPQAPIFIECPLSATTKRVLRHADEESRRMSYPQIGTEHLIVGILREQDSVAARVLNRHGLRLDQIRNIMSQPPGHDRQPSPGKGQSHLSRFSRDMTGAASAGRLDPLIGRHAEIERIIQILSRRTKNTPVLIGEPGVGKTAIVEGLAQRIVASEVPSFLRNKRILALDLSLVIAGTKYRGEFEERLKEIVRELTENPDLIIFIDEVHTLVGAGAAEGSLDAANILKPALARAEIQCIGATTPAEFRKTIERNRSLERRFQAVKVSAPSEDETIKILDGIRSRYESFHSVRYSPDALETAVSQAQRYIPDRFLPDKAIDIIDEAGARVRLRQERLTEDSLAQISESGRDDRKSDHARDLGLKPYGPNQVIAEVTRHDIEEVISIWTGIPITSLKEEDREKLLHIEESLHSRIISQDRAISALARAIRRTRAGLKNANRPIGSFLFLGPTGVGKTEVARTLAEYLFGSERALIRFDMSEYMEKHSVSKLIGSPPGYVGFEEGGQLTERIKRNPYSVLLLDEIEKAHPDIFNILLQVFEEGVLTNSFGDATDFKNVIVIMTSNIGARLVQKRGVLGFQAADAIDETYNQGILQALKHTFNPELINRFDEIIIFDPLTEEDLLQIVDLLVRGFNSRTVYQKLRIQMTDEARRWIVDKTCGDRSYGARPLRRALERYVEDPLSEAIIASRFPEGTVLEIFVEDDHLEFRAAGVEMVSIGNDLITAQ